MLYDNLEIKDGRLTVAGIDTGYLAEKYGTPLFVLDEDRVRKHCRLYKDAAAKYFGKDSRICYASKALSFTGIYKIMADEGLYTDIVSPGELYTARCAGFDVSHALFHGNNKTDDDINYAIESGVGYFVIDNTEELDEVDRAAQSHGVCQKILIRITPGIDPHTHKAVITGNVDSKFGSAIKTGQAEEMCRLALSKMNVELCGFHCHIGSQIFDIEPFCDAADIMLAFAADMKAIYNYEAKIINLGGGFGVRYVESQPVFDIEAGIEALAAHIENGCIKLGIKKPAIFMEPGRSIVADCCLTLYTVGSVKDIRGYKSYVSIDGGMTDNPRYALYESEYTALIANRASEPADFKCTIAGRCCESGDLIQENIMLQKCGRGDTLAVLCTGAYNYSMASNYNRIPRPPIVLLSNGKDKLAVRRESYADLTANDIE